MFIYIYDRFDEDVSSTYCFMPVPRRKKQGPFCRAGRGGEKLISFFIPRGRYQFFGA